MHKSIIQTSFKPGILLLLFLCLFISTYSQDSIISEVINRHDSIINKHTEQITPNSNFRRSNAGNRRLIDTNEARININKGKILQNDSQINTNQADIKSNVTDIESLQKDIGVGRNNIEVNKSFIDRFWVLIAAALVFLMQAGFKVFEVGIVRSSKGDMVGMKNLLDWLVLCLAYYFLGFGLMFGEAGALFGTSLFLPTYETMNGLENTIPLGLEFFLYQLAFAAASATIVSGAMAERTSLTGYLITSVFVGVLIYPIFGHWVWGGSFITTNSPWLANLGFRDFAGSTVVHSIGAWVALVGIYFVGPRKGRFNDNGEVNREDFEPHSLGYSVLGVFILWFGWWGFNGGSNLKYDHNISSIILNSNLAAAVSGLVAYAFSWLFQNDEDTYEKLLGGVLGGLVAITACCDVVTPADSLLIGLGAGIIHNLAFVSLLKLRLDDPVGAIPVHGACGIWGTLCVAFFGDMELINSITKHSYSLSQQLGIQIIGILIALGLAITLSVLLFAFLKYVLLKDKLRI